MEQDMEDALKAIASMIDRSETAQKKFTQGTSQHTLLINRIHALNVALSLIKDEVEGNTTSEYKKENLEKSVAPIASLISKTEKAQSKLTQETWQYKMTENNLKALYIASSLLHKALFYI